MLFLADAADDAEISSIEQHEDDHPAVFVLLNLEGGSYAEKINRGVEVTGEMTIFTGADDLDFQPGWFEAAKAAMVDGVEVVGVNDLIDRKRDHATHFLMTRAYAERPTIDGEAGPLCAGYWHWYCDDELIATARKRGVYAYAADSNVKHLHPMAGNAKYDATYQKGRERMRQDRRLFQRRSKLWA